MSYENGRITRREAEELRRRRAYEMEQRRRQENRRRKKRRGKRTVVIILLILLALILGLLAFIYSKLKRIQTTKLDGIVTCYDTGNYTNIALFGLDSREGEITSGVNSDTIIVASINNKTKEVKLVSVYRDTYLQQEDGSYDKANAAYCNGGAVSAINMLNKNLDLDIEKFATVNFKALINVVDMLGGLDINMTGEEVVWMNGYVIETAIASDMLAQANDNEEIYDGIHHLDGIQATAYCRIRYTDGGDYQRTERQRIILNAILDKAKHTSIFKLNEIANTVLPQVYTNLSTADMMKMMILLKFYKLTDTQGFPFDKEAGWYNEYGQDCVVPIGLAQNVVKLHGFLFPEQAYTPSETVNSINNDIIYLTDIDPAYYGL